MRTRIRRFTPTIQSLATAYDDQSGADELVIPESFDGMATDAVLSLHDEAVAQFNALYAEVGDAPTAEQIEQLAAVTAGIEALASEIATRNAATAERQAEAAGFAERVQALSADTATDEEDATDEGADSEDGGDEADDEDAADSEDATDEGAAETIVASGAQRGEVRISRRAVQRENPAPVVTEAARAMGYSTGSGTGFAAGQEMSIMDVARAIDQKMLGFNQSGYQAAARSGRQMSETHNIVAFKREFAPDLILDSTDRNDVERVLNRAVDESRLPQGSLVASGGWCAPSENLYDFLELETREGMLSLPEIQVNRGGINFTQGPSFGDIFADITGFSFTEQDDIDGKYQPSGGGNVVGPKPCYHIECPDFQDVRLHVDGVCITAGLLQSRGYPEIIARTVRGALIAHEHRLNGRKIAQMVAGSTAVNLGNQQGAAAPILGAIELQAQHYRATHRLGLTASLEAVFPFWVFSAIRADLSRRLGVDLISVPDARVRQWFTERYINPQFVYNWQAIDATAASAFNAWPTTVSFLLYAAGTWVGGVNDIITLDTLYDSTLLAQNDFTALFTEEGWLVAKRGHDSRMVTVGIEAAGATHMGVDIAHNGTLAPAAVVPGATEDAPLFTSEVTP